MRTGVAALALLFAGPALAAEAVLAPNGNPLHEIPLADLTASKERPLFSPSRRPPEAPPTVAVAPRPTVAPTPDAPPEPPPFQLVGALMGPRGAIALLRKSSGDQIVSLHEGQSEDGWTARKIGPRFVDIEKDGVSARLEILKANSDAPLSPDAMRPPETPAR